MTTYDQWKTTDPRDYEREQDDDAPSELDLAYDRIIELERNNKFLTERVEKLVAELKFHRS